jgi:hypothetical protein
VGLKLKAIGVCRRALQRGRLAREQLPSLAWLRWLSEKGNLRAGERNLHPHRRKQFFAVEELRRALP